LGATGISRSNPASARYYGDGYCGSIYEGAIGTGGLSGLLPTIRSLVTDIRASILPSTSPALLKFGLRCDSGVVVFAG
jgi:hypothetical protein